MNSSEQLFQTKLALFEKHTAEHGKIRQKIHNTTEKYVTLMFALLAFLKSDLVQLTCSITWIVTIAVVIIMSILIYMVLKDNANSYRHAKIVNILNQNLGFYDNGGVIDNITLYPNSWKKDKSIALGAILHCLVIILMTALVIISLFVI